ncbi:MAG: Txe/YoeB family addiction module toxin [Chthoniobacterales bacterium]
MPKFNLVFAPSFLEQYDYWTTKTPKIAAKIDELVRSIAEGLFKGIGKPEPLRWGPFKGSWSRRITGEHRIVYRVDKATSNFLQCRYHY